MRISDFFLLLGASVTMAAANAAEAGATTLAELEARVGQAGMLRQADAQVIAAQARHEMVASDTGVRLFGSMSLAYGRDAVRPERYRIDNLQDSGLITSTEHVLTALPDARQRVGAQLGIRLPLFGSRRLLDEAVAQASGAVSVQRYRRKAVEMEALKALRYAYSEAYFRRTEQQLAREYLAREPEARGYLDARGARGLILRDEQRRLLATFAEAAQYQGEAAAAEEAALASIGAMTGLALKPGQLADPGFRVHCLSAGTLHDALESHPDIAYHRELAEQRRREVAAAAAGLVEGSLSVAQSASRENSGRSGYASAIAVDLSMPLGYGRWRAARRGVAVAELQRAQLALDGRRDEYTSGVRAALRSRELAHQRLETAQQQLAAEAEGVRIAELRLARTRQDSEELLLRKRYAHYGAARAVVHASLALALREADLLGFAGRCDSANLDGGRAEATSGVLREAGSGRTVAGPADAADDRVPPASVALGWYGWRLFERVAAANPDAVLKALARGERILMSLTRAEIGRVKAGGEQRALLRQFLDAARGAGVRVELLLGDPHWALREHHADLLEVLHDLQGLPFAGLHLDIEREQLAPAHRARWADDIAALTRRVGETSALPLALSIHPRDASDGLLRALAANGADEVTVMYYNTQAPLVSAFLAGLMKRHPQIGFSLAQSIEPELPDTESYARRSPGQAVAALRGLSDTLAHPNFRGVLVQSLDHYLERVHEN